MGQLKSLIPLEVVDTLLKLMYVVIGLSVEINKLQSSAPFLQLCCTASLRTDSMYINDCMFSELKGWLACGFEPGVY